MTKLIFVSLVLSATAMADALPYTTVGPEWATCVRDMTRKYLDDHGYGDSTLYGDVEWAWDGYTLYNQHARHQDGREIKIQLAAKTSTVRVDGQKRTRCEFRVANDGQAILYIVE